MRPRSIAWRLGSHEAIARGSFRIRLVCYDRTIEASEPSSQGRGQESDQRHDTYQSSLLAFASHASSRDMTARGGPSHLLT
jgi:hypothetical protein